MLYHSGAEATPDAAGMIHQAITAMASRFINFHFCVIVEEAIGKKILWLWVRLLLPIERVMGCFNFDIAERFKAAAKCGGCITNMVLGRNGLQSGE